MTQYLYGNPGNPFQLTASRATDNTLTTYSYDTSGNLFAFERAGTRYYVATDQLGTPKVVTYDNGTIVKQAEYDAWGVKLSDSAPTFDLPVGFAGGIPEPVTGLVRFGFRDYEPGTGRWVARDPILFEGEDFNLYAYVWNCPTSWFDESGEKGQKGKKGERGWSGSPSGTKNPFKHLDPHPTDPSKVIYKDPHTGKRVTKAKPPGYDDQNKGNNCKYEVASNDERWDIAVNTVTGLGATYAVYRIVRFAPSLLPPFWWTIPANALAF